MNCDWSLSQGKTITLYVLKVEWFYVVAVQVLLAKYKTMRLEFTNIFMYFELIRSNESFLRGAWNNILTYLNTKPIQIKHP